MEVVKRLNSVLRRAVIAIAIVLISAAGASATPMTQTDWYSASDPVAKFDTNLGTLVGIEVMFTYLIRLPDPFLTEDRRDDWCSATINGANLTLGTGGGTQIMSSSPSQPTTRWGCDSGYFDIIEMDFLTLDTSYFSEFISAGPSALPMMTTFLYDSATVTAEDPIEVQQVRAWLAGWSGSVTYTYETASMPVPEPTTAAMLVLGLAGLGYRRYKLNQAHD
jgi:hypothetical protein